MKGLLLWLAVCLDAPALVSSLPTLSLSGVQLNPSISSPSTRTSPSPSWAYYSALNTSSGYPVSGWRSTNSYQPAAQITTIPANTPDESLESGSVSTEKCENDGPGNEDRPSPPQSSSTADDVFDAVTKNSAFNSILDHYMQNPAAPLQSSSTLNIAANAGGFVSQSAGNWMGRSRNATIRPAFLFKSSTSSAASSTAGSTITNATKPIPTTTGNWTGPGPSLQTSDTSLRTTTISGTSSRTVSFTTSSSRGWTILGINTSLPLQLQTLAGSESLPATTLSSSSSSPVTTRAWPSPTSGASNMNTSSTLRPATSTGAVLSTTSFSSYNSSFEPTETWQEKDVNTESPVTIPLTTAGLGSVAISISSTVSSTPVFFNTSTLIGATASTSTSIPTIAIPSFSTAATATVNCMDGTWDLTVLNYQKADTDKSLQAWWSGGADSDGYMYSGQGNGTGQLVQSLAKAFEPLGSDSSFMCSLETECDPVDDCNNYRLKLPAMQSVGRPSHWAWFAVHSIANINSFSKTLMQSLQNAGIEESFASMDLTKTFSKPPRNPSFFAREFMLGFALVCSIAFSFVPVAGEIAGAAAAAQVGLSLAGAVGGALGSSVGSSAGFWGIELGSADTLDEKAANFGAFASVIWNDTITGLDHIVSGLVSGALKDGNDPLLLGMMTGGGWVDTSILAKSSLSQSEVSQVLYHNLVARGINFIWSQSKIWISFVDLQDDANHTKCLADKNGWQASKTCADGGVYYLYRFNEDGNLEGHLTYPWGADVMTQSPWNLDPSWVTASSAKSYRAQNQGNGGFSYTSNDTMSHFPSVLESIGSAGNISALNTMEGVWNISVCDMGTHRDWNTDFTQKNPTSSYGLQAFPCCCGPQCSQTADFIRASQMENFQTIKYFCENQLASCDAWPANVTQVDFGQAGKIVKKKPNQGMCL